MSFSEQNPFPGVNPYVQRRWGEFHTDFIVAFRDAMRGLLPPGLRYHIEASITVETTDTVGTTTRQSYRPDGFVSDTYTPEAKLVVHRPEPTNSQDDGGVLVAEPVEVEVLPEEIKERFIEVVDSKNNNRVITTIEVLSPSNKIPSVGLESFRHKQGELRAAGVNLVEIDLIRGFLPGVTARVPDLGATPYCVAIQRGWNFVSATYYALTLRHRLPVIEVPLRQKDAPLMIDLQAVYQECFERSECWRDIDYSTEPKPPLSPAEAAWADQWLRAKGLR